MVELRRFTVLSCLLSIGALLSAGAAGAETLDLNKVMDLARAKDPSLRLQEELAFQQGLARDKVLTGLSPTLSVVGSYTLNDPVVKLDLGSGTSAITDLLIQQATLNGYALAQLWQAGELSDAECVELAGIYELNDPGITDCLSLFAALQEQADNQDDGEESEPRYITPRHQLGFSINANWRLSPRLGTQYKMADLTRTGAYARADWTASQIRYGIYQIYVGLYRAQEEERLAGEALVLAKKHLELEEARLAVGSADETAVLRQQAEVLTAEQNLLRAQTGRMGAARKLADRIGVSEQDLRVADPMATPAGRGIKPDLDVESEARAAAQNRPDMVAREADLKAAKQYGLDAGLSWLPNFLFGFTWSTGKGIQDGKALTAGFSDKDSSSRFTINAVWDIWDGGLRLVNQREAASRVRAAQLALEQGERTVRDEVLSAAESLEAAHKGVDAATSKLAVSTRLLDLTERRVTLGMADSLELADVRLLYERSRLDELYSRLAVDDALWRLELALGAR